MFPKLAILCLYLRLFTEKLYRFSSYTLIGILITTAVVNCISAGVSCTPFAYNWDKTIPGGRCFADINSWYLWVSFPNILTDVFMLILPLPVIWKLQMSRKNKVGLTVVFCTGSM